MLRKLWSVGKHLGVKWVRLCGKQHLEASYHIIRDQYLGDLWSFTIQAFPMSLVLKLRGPLLACPFLEHKSETEGYIFTSGNIRYKYGQVRGLAWLMVRSFPKWWDPVSYLVKIHEQINKSLNASLSRQTLLQVFVWEKKTKEG